MGETLVQQLLEAGVHFGHQTKRWNPKMRPFIFGSRSGIHIINLEKTEQHLQAACDFLEDIAAKGQRILYVGTKKQARSILEREAQRAGMPYAVNRWLGGTLTNFQTIKANIDKLRTLRQQREEGFFERVSKKDAKRMLRQMERLEEHFAGLIDLDRIPGCMYIVDVKREDIAVHEANRLNIPIVAICDTNADPSRVAYPIPGNDDAIRAIQLITSLVTERILAGKHRFEVEHVVPVQEAAVAGAPEVAAEAEPASGSEAPVAP